MLVLCTAVLSKSWVKLKSTVSFFFVHTLPAIHSAGPFDLVGVEAQGPGPSRERGNKEQTLDRNE
jgi:hypothetical protein